MDLTDHLTKIPKTTIESSCISLITGMVDGVIVNDHCSIISCKDNEWTQNKSPDVFFKFHGFIATNKIILLAVSSLPCSTDNNVTPCIQCLKKAKQEMKRIQKKNRLPPFSGSKSHLPNCVQQPSLLLLFICQVLLWKNLAQTLLQNCWNTFQSTHHISDFTRLQIQ